MVGVSGGQGLAAKALVMSRYHSLFGRISWYFMHVSHDHLMRLQPLVQVQVQVWVCWAFIVLLEKRIC